MVKNLPTMWETWARCLGWEDPPEEGMEPTPVLLPGESHGQRSLGGNSSWGHKELDTTEQLSINKQTVLSKTLKLLPNPLGEERLLLQYSGLENSMDCIIHGVSNSPTGLSDFHFYFPFLPLLYIWWEKNLLPETLYEKWLLRSDFRTKIIIILGLRIWTQNWYMTFLNKKIQLVIKQTGNPGRKYILRNLFLQFSVAYF